MPHALLVYQTCRALPSTLRWPPGLSLGGAVVPVSVHGRQRQALSGTVTVGYLSCIIFDHLPTVWWIYATHSVESYFNNKGCGGSSVDAWHFRAVLAYTSRLLD